MIFHELQAGIKGMNSKKTKFKNSIFLYILAIPGILYFLIFKYLPMFGIIIAFQDFSVVKGFFKSEFVGFENFKFFFGTKDWIRVTFNTIYLNILFIITGLVFAIGTAIIISEINNKMFKKITQSIVILPNFISWTLVSMFCLTLFSSDIGLINTTLRMLGLKAVNFYGDAKLWPFILVTLKIWKSAGFNSVVYLAAITGIDPEIYEAAKIDGASRLQCILRITIPQLKTTAILLTIFGIGGIFYGDFGMIYAIVGDNSFLFSTTDVIDTYVYRQLRQIGDMSMSAAAGFYQSIVGFVIVLATNALARKFEPDSAIF